MKITTGPDGVKRHEDGLLWYPTPDHEGFWWIREGSMTHGQKWDLTPVTVFLYDRRGPVFHFTPDGNGDGDSSEVTDEELWGPEIQAWDPEIQAWDPEKPQ